jgi:hypothetical protein
MGLFKRKPKPVMNREQALNMVVVRNETVRSETGAGGLVRLHYEVASRPWFGRLAERVGMWDGSPVQRTLELDELGSFVWNTIDDKQTVRALSERFVQRYRVQTREAEVAVTEFLRQLGRRGLIALL